MQTREHNPVNREIYDRLGKRWYTAKDDPVALLRAESRARNPWIVQEIRHAFPTGAVRVLDVGCGAGFLSNELARQGFAVTGLDASISSLQVAEQYDATGTVRYETGDAYELPYPVGSFEVACAMDFLEHVEQPARVVAEISRVLAPGGLFFFHTFNRNRLSWLIAIKGVEWFVRNTPRDLHVLPLFIKPSELQSMCAHCGLRVTSLRGLAPNVATRAFATLLLTGRVDDDFAFEFTTSTRMAYIGLAVKGS
jgi:2-polyprenyl-6-hydroxyphenyl methylase/3-demethylubiquinone-9 3-methyltransferase